MAVYLPSQDKYLWRSFALLQARLYGGEPLARSLAARFMEEDQIEQLEAMMAPPPRPWWKRLLGLR